MVSTTGADPYVCGIICLKEAQSTDVSSPKYTDFSVERSLSVLSYLKRKKLVRFFVRRPIATDADAILLTQHFANLGVMSFHEQKQLYRALRDRLPSGVRLAVKKASGRYARLPGIFPGGRSDRGGFSLGNCSLTYSAKSLP